MIRIINLIPMRKPATKAPATKAKNINPATKAQATKAKNINPTTKAPATKALKTCHKGSKILFYTHPI
jgi:hypothetical protein